MAASAFSGAASRAVRRMSMVLPGRKSKKVQPSGMPQLVVGKKIADRFWLPDLKAASIDVNSSQLQQVTRQTSTMLNSECRMLATHMQASNGKLSHLVGICNMDTLLALFEVEDNKDGVLFKRVCDYPTRELIRLESFPANSEWPKKYEPVNTYGGSRKLPSRASAGDLMTAVSD